MSFKRKVVDPVTGGFDIKDHFELVAKFKAHELVNCLKAPKKFYEEKENEYYRNFA